MNETITNLEKYIEYTILKPDATTKNLKTIFEDAKEFNFFGVCINPVHVKFAKEYLSDTDIKIVTVVGFPLGANITEVKKFEAQKAIEDGADELDMVIDIGSLKDKNYVKVQYDIKQVVAVSGNKPVKVIIETDLLSREEIITACKIVADAEAAFVKTSTGFVKDGIGATVENVKLMKETVKPYGLEVKASAGIRDVNTALEMIKAGASRIGTSACLTLN